MSDIVIYLLNNTNKSNSIMLLAVIILSTLLTIAYVAGGFLMSMLMEWDPNKVSDLLCIIFWPFVCAYLIFKSHR